MKTAVCEYEECGEPAFATEGLTGTNMKLCLNHVKLLFGKFLKNAEIVVKPDEEKVGKN